MKKRKIYFSALRNISYSNKFGYVTNNNTKKINKTYMVCIYYYLNQILCRENVLFLRLDVMSIVNLNSLNISIICFFILSVFLPLHFLTIIKALSLYKSMSYLLINLQNYV